MKKSQRMQIKAILSIIGIVVLVILAVTGVATGVKKLVKTQPEGEYITIEDVRILLQAASVQDDVLAEAAATDFLTYEECLSMELPVENFTEEYGKKHFVLKMDWYQAYDAWLIEKGLQESITSIDLVILGMNEQILSADGMVLEEGLLLTEEAAMPYLSDKFRNYTNENIRVYEKDGVLLTVKEVLKTEYTLHNVWVMGESAKELRYFWNNYEITIPKDSEEEMETVSEQVADISFSDGILSKTTYKMEKVNGKLLGIKDGVVTIEGVGEFPVADNFKIYKLYDKLERAYTSNLRIGYDFTDFVLENGQIAACLMTRDEAMENIRVLIKNSDYAGAMHEKVSFTADTDFLLRYGEYDAMQEVSISAGEVVDIDVNSEYFVGDRIYVIPTALTGKIHLLSVNRSQGAPWYRGEIEIVKTVDGLVVINEALLEEYLYCVVPSEMPSSYPLEALKAQAICARTYAYRNMLKAGLTKYGAHVDDSAGYQVYNNIQENAQTTKAVRETSGKLIYHGEELAGTYYYSTSCGFGTDTNIWKSESTEDLSYLQAERIGSTLEENYSKESMTNEDTFHSFITNTFDSDYESKEGWYRWKYVVEEIDCKAMSLILQNRYEANDKLILTKTKNGEYVSEPPKAFDSISDIQIAKRNAGGVIDELLIITNQGTWKVISEHNVRYVLNNGISKIDRQDGSHIDSASLLPSAFFVIETSKENENVVGYTLIGGGYGHGVGMSQNGARNMAMAGMDEQSILTFFYENCEVKNVY